jgi:hypothetical protein
MATRTPKYEALLKAMATKPMNYTEIKNWLASRSAGYANADMVRLHDFSLYGTDKRQGILERFCRKNNDGRWQTVVKVEAPYTPVRNETSGVVFFW